MNETAAYPVPNRQLGLTGPVDKPRPGTLPIRGDVAHIALADRYLVPHYVVPRAITITSGPVSLLLAAEDGAEVLKQLATGDTLEMLDITSSWVWGCLGPDGPTGYIKRAALDI
ncbi:MAG: hypothetical protein HKO05_07705 [Erythrobacter sp.]|nr:hypothetical protein [Erythrobacter sp.]